MSHLFLFSWYLSFWYFLWISGFSWYLVFPYSISNYGFSWYLAFSYSLSISGLSWHICFWKIHFNCWILFAFTNCTLGFSWYFAFWYLIFDAKSFRCFCFFYCFIYSFLSCYLVLTASLFFLDLQGLSFFWHLMAFLIMRLQDTFINCTWMYKTIAKYYNKQIL